MVWGFLIFVSYNAILTSVLANSNQPTLIESLEEILQSPDYTLIFRSFGATRNFFENAPENSIGTLATWPQELLLKSKLI